MNSIVRAIKIEREVCSADFRSAMRHLTGGVSVITVGRGSEVSGMTVTSVSSLSVDPPSLIVGINRSSSSWPLLKQYGCFSEAVSRRKRILFKRALQFRQGLLQPPLGAQIPESIRKPHVRRRRVELQGAVKVALGCGPVILEQRAYRTQHRMRIRLIRVQL